MLQPGQIISGRWQVAKFVNRGGMADVWIAIDLEAKPQKKVAFKIMRDAIPAVSDRFLREAEIHKSLSSPNILPFYDNGFFEFNAVKYPFCVFPYVAGGRTLEHVISEAEPELDPSGKIKGSHIEAKRCLDLMIQIATGVRDAHNSQPSVVHRDIKPGNILVSPISIGRERAFVTDFGIGRFYEMTLSSTRKLTVVGCLGTREYMSPQQAFSPTDDPERDKLRFDPRNDVWSVGVTFFEMLTGAMPFPYDGTNDSQVFAEVFAGRKPDPVSKYCIGIDPRLEAMVMQCLEYELEDRPTMDEVLAVLNEVLFADNSLFSIQPPAETVADVDVPIASSRTLTPSEFHSQIGKAETEMNPSTPPARRSGQSGRETLEAPPGYHQDASDDDESERRGFGVGSAVMAVLLIASLGVLAWFGYNQWAVKAAPQGASLVVASSFVPTATASSEVPRNAAVAVLSSASVPTVESAASVSASASVAKPMASASASTSVKKPRSKSSGRRGGYGASPPPTVMYPEIRDNSFQ